MCLGLIEARAWKRRPTWLTWLTPGAKQEAVAAELGLPFNTCRYDLARGAERVAQALWQAELLARGR